MLRDLGAENVPRSLGGQSHQADLQLPTKVMRPREGFGKLLAAWKPQELLHKSWGVVVQLENMLGIEVLAYN